MHVFLPLSFTEGKKNVPGDLTLQQRKLKERLSLKDFKYTVEGESNFDCSCYPKYFLFT